MKGPYKIGTLARLTGFSPALLRVWERRYGLITPARGDGRQRLYEDDDLAVLKRVRAFVDQGRTIGEIAARGREGLLAGADADREDARGAVSSSGAASFCERIVAGALALDGRRVNAALDEAFATLGADQVVADVIVPAETRIGQLWEAGRCSVASEHMASSRFLHRLGRLLETAQPAGDSAPRVVASCFPDEHHQLGLLVVSWHLARHGIRVDYLGSAMPFDDLAKACQAAPPRALLLSVTRRPAFARSHRDMVRRFSSTTGRIYVGGQGVPPSVQNANRRFVYVQATPAEQIVRRIVADLNARSAAR